MYTVTTQPVLTLKCRKCNVVFFEQTRETVMIIDRHGHEHEVLPVRSHCRRCEAWTAFKALLQ